MIVRCHHPSFLSGLGSRVARTAIVCGLILFCSCDRASVNASQASTASDGGSLELVTEIGNDPVDSDRSSFGVIRDVLLTTNHQIWVSDASESGADPRLRLYDSTGTFIREVARRGGGPGEFARVGALAEFPNGNVAYRDDGAPTRVLIFSPAGDLLDHWPNARQSGWPRDMRFVGNSPFALMIDSTARVWLPFRGGRPGQAMRETGILRVSADGDVLEVVDWPDFPVLERPTQLIEGTSLDGRARFSTAVPYQPTIIRTWSPMGEFAGARSDRYEVELGISALVEGRSADSTDRRSVKRERARVQVADDEKRAIRQQLQDVVDGWGSNIRSTAVPKSVPDYKPALRSLSFSEDGELMVLVSVPSTYSDPEWTEPGVFDVFDKAGRDQGAMQIPPGRQMLRMRNRLVWGVFTTADGAQVVRVFQVVLKR